MARRGGVRLGTWLCEAGRDKVGRGEDRGQDWYGGVRQGPAGFEAMQGRARPGWAGLGMEQGTCR